MTKFSLEHIIRNIAEGKFTPSDEPKVTLEHAIREVHESVGTLGTDKFQGSQFRTAKTVAPVIKPGHNERSETAANARNTAKTDRSLTVHGRVSENAPSDMGNVSAQLNTESGKKKIVKETPAPNYGDAAQVASWPASEGGKKKVKEETEQVDELSIAVIKPYLISAKNIMKKIANKDPANITFKDTDTFLKRKAGVERATSKMQEEAEGTKDRREIEFRPRKKDSPDRKDIKYVGRPDDADPKSKKSILGRTGSVTTRSGGYVDVEEEKIIAGKTPVIIDPVLKQVTPEGDMKAANKKHKNIVKQAVKEMKEDATSAIASKAAGSLGKKVLPGIGLAYGAADAYSRAKSGDYTGAALSGLSGLASTVPGVGTAAATALDAANIYRDYKSGAFDDKKDEPKSAEQPKSSQTNEPVKPVSTNVNKPKPNKIKPFRGTNK